jgi:putative ABC transport system substrate-binding protein
MSSGIKRRAFITLLGGAAAAWPLVPRAQQRESMRRVGVLQNFAADDPEGQVRLTAFGQGLQQLGWTVGRNMRIDYRWSAGDPERIRKSVADILALSPDIILAAGGRNMSVLQQPNRTIPVVFVTISDPVSGGFVESMSHPGGNATGFSILEWSMSGKWLELLKQLVPEMTRVAVLRDPGNPGGTAQLGAILGVAPTLGVAVNPGRNARCRRNRARIDGFCPRAERRPDRYVEYTGRGASGFDHCARRPSPAACHVFCSLYRRCRRPALLRA